MIYNTSINLQVITDHDSALATFCVKMQGHETAHVLTHHILLTIKDINACVWGCNENVKKMHNHFAQI